MKICAHRLKIILTKVSNLSTIIKVITVCHCQSDSKFYQQKRRWCNKSVFISPFALLGKHEFNFVDKTCSLLKRSRLRVSY